MADLVEVLRTLGLVGADRIQPRPWGLYVDWFRTPEATLKCIIVQPGARMSLQRHQHRSEVWRVVSGRGEDQGLDPPSVLEPGMTHTIPAGAVHRMANTGKEPLVVVELQMGTCREDDIERLADDYARA